MAGSQTVTRTVTNITGNDAQYDPAVSAPPGTSVTVSPSKLVVPAGGSTSFTVTFTRTTAALNVYTFGSLTWVEKQQKEKRSHQARIPIADRPVVAAVPAEVTQIGTSGSAALPVKLGYTGTLTAAANGLIASTVTTMHLVGESQSFSTGNPQAGPAVGKLTVAVPAGSLLARFRLYNAEHPADTDLDLFVYRAGTNQLVGSSAGGTADESLTLNSPTAGSYDAYVVQFDLPPGVTELDVRHHDWVVGSGAAGNLTVTPASQTGTVGQTLNVTASWTGLTAGSRYLGVIEYGDGTAGIGRTIFGVNP